MSIQGNGNNKPAWKYYWLLMRPGNLGIIVLTMSLFMLHAGKWNPVNLRWPESLTVIIAVLFTAAAGYVINDIFDIEEDIINKPEKRIIAKHISLKKAHWFYGVLVALSLITGFITGWSVGFLCLVMNLLLYFYSSDLKGTNLWGNLLISFLNGVVVFTSGQGTLIISDGYFAEYALLAFLITFAREIVKDIEDVEGDRTQEYETFPIVYGANKAAWLTVGILTLLNLLVVYLMTESGNTIFIGYSLIFIIMPVFWFYFRLIQAETKKDYGQIQRMMKGLMITGILSVIFI